MVINTCMHYYLLCFELWIALDATFVIRPPPMRKNQYSFIFINTARRSLTTTTHATHTQSYTFNCDRQVYLYCLAFVHSMRQ